MEGESSLRRDSDSQWPGYCGRNHSMLDCVCSQSYNGSVSHGLLKGVKIESSYESADSEGGKVGLKIVHEASFIPSMPAFITRDRDDSELPYLATRRWLVGCTKTHP